MNPRGRGAMEEAEGRRAERSRRSTSTWRLEAKGRRRGAAEAQVHRRFVPASSRLRREQGVRAAPSIPQKSIIAGAATGGFLSMRQGAGAAGRAALMGGALLVLIEGVGLMLNHVLATSQNLPPLPADYPNLAAAMAAGGGGILGLPQAPVSPTEAASSNGGGGWFGYLVGKKEEEKKPNAGGGKSEILESFDTLSDPIPSFEYK